MSKVKYTKEQQQSINLRDKNIIVSAQAGAGKTQVLVQRIISLLDEEKIDIDKFLIVTFTNKAAAEMKDRIKKGLHNKLELAENAEKLFYQRQYNNTTNAQISTMHSFCINVLRDYFYKLGLNPAFKILTGSSLDILKWQTINEVFTDLYKEENPEFFTLLDMYSKKYSDEYLKLILFELYQFIQSQIHPFEWLKQCIDKYNLKEYYNEKNHYDNFKDEVFKYYKNNFDNLYHLFSDISIQIDKIQQYAEYKIYQKTLSADRDVLTKIYNSSNYDEFVSLTDTFKFDRLETITKKVKETNNIDDDFVNDIKSRINEYRDKIKDFIKSFDLDIDKEIIYEDELKRSLEAMHFVLERFDKKFKSNKLKNGSLDFSDVEHLTIDLLDDEEIVSELKDRFKYIFFDEYQDSNQVQNYIVNKISRGNNLFFVGDIKQSIYKFRLADPIIFKNRYENYLNETEINQAIDLKHNFRSERVLLHFNNFIFNTLMTDKLGDVKYDDEAHRLTPGLSEEKYDDKNASVDLIYISKEKEELDNLEVDMEIKEIDPEAVFVAKKIKELVKQGETYKDMAVLSRTAAIIPDIEQCFKIMDIPYFSDSSKFSFDDIELKLFIEILKAIDNDTDDIVLLSAITSTISNITDEDLAEIRSTDKENSFNYCFRNYHKREDAKQEIIDKINIYNSKMSTYRKNVKVMSLESFVWYVLIDSGHMAYVLSKKNGDKILDNINLFIQEISEFENSSFQTLTSLINYVDKMSERKLGDREAGADLSEEDDVVRVMTIHKSKGLQFKNVFMVSLNKRFNMIDLKEELILDDKYGLSLKNYDEDKNEKVKNFFYLRIEDVKRHELYSEEVRVLYVGLTRAEKKLFLVSSDKTDNLVYGENLEELNSYHKWIYSIISRDKISENFIDSPKTTDYFKNKESNLSFTNINETDLIDYYSSFITSDNIDEDYEVKEIDEQISKVLNFEYDKTKVDIPYKKTVTEISEKDRNISPDFIDYEIMVEDEPYSEPTLLEKKPKFLEINKNKMDALSLGNLYHYILEILPLDYSEISQVEKFIANLYRDKFISKIEYESINLEIIFKYIKSDLYKRLSKADKIFRERSFTMIYEEMGNEFLVDGQIDLYFIENNEITILDFKTNRVIDEDLYKTQLELYRMGLERATGLKVKEKLIYWVMHGVTSSI
ncbi:UvrD-helicase domain-containing protein [Helcococcus kunzii]|uniref:UvrD-helicase domain-containing protein n=1 Tax=Helcococcus kunzii TaxID=40091 RepID=UPI0038AA2DDA